MKKITVLTYLVCLFLGSKILLAADDYQKFEDFEGSGCTLNKIGWALFEAGSYGAKGYKLVSGGSGAAKTWLKMGYVGSLVLWAYIDSFGNLQFTTGISDVEAEGYSKVSFGSQACVEGDTKLPSLFGGGGGAVKACLIIPSQEFEKSLNINVPDINMTIPIGDIVTLGLVPAKGIILSAAAGFGALIVVWDGLEKIAKHPSRIYPIHDYLSEKTKQCLAKMTEPFLSRSDVDKEDEPRKYDEDDLNEEGCSAWLGSKFRSIPGLVCTSALCVGSVGAMIVEVTKILLEASDLNSSNSTSFDKAGNYTRPYSEIANGTLPIGNAHWGMGINGSVNFTGSAAGSASYELDGYNGPNIPVLVVGTVGCATALGMQCYEFFTRPPKTRK
jgi:hypothetical protein